MPNTGKKPLVSIVITTRDRYAMFMRCVRSVAGARYDRYELIVIDDNSSDKTRSVTKGAIARIARGAIRIDVVHARTHIKMVRARNLGAKRSRGKYVLFIDDDNVIHPSMIDELTAFAQAHPEYGILGPSNFTLVPKKHNMDGQRINFFTGRTKGLCIQDGREYTESDGAPNVFMIARSVFSSSGYFDEAIVQTFTEPDFAFAARKKGIGCAFVARAITYHDIPTGVYNPRTLGGEYAHKAYYTMRNRGLIIFRYGRWYHRVVYALIFSWLWALIYSALVARFGRFDLVRLYWYGWRDAMIFFFTKRLVNSISRILR